MSEPLPEQPTVRLDLSAADVGNLRIIIQLGRPHLPSAAWRDTAEELFDRIGEAESGFHGAKCAPFRPDALKRIME